MIKAQEADWQRCWLMGQECLMSEDRVDRSTIPEGFFSYALRHGDDPGVPCTIESSACVNYYGVLLTNDNLPIDDNGYLPLSKGDLIISPEYTTLGEWQESIEARKAGPPTEWMRVIIVEPMKPPRVDEIPHTLAGMQAVVGGTIQSLTPYSDPVAIVCNDDGKLIGLEPNRILRDKYGSPYDYLCGTFFVCGLGEEDFASLPPDMERKYMVHFRGEMLVPEHSRPRHKKPKAPER